MRKKVVGDGAANPEKKSMATSRVSLSARTIQNMAPGDTLRDTKIQGLHVRAFSTRTAFYLYYRTAAGAGAERRPKLGTWPAMSVDMAREKAAEMLREAVRGGDPSRDKRKSRDRTIAGLFEQYMAEHGTKKKTAKQDQYRAAKYVLPLLGPETPVASVTYADVYAAHQSLSDKPYQANRVLALVSKAFNLAEAWGWREQNSNPCQHVVRFKERRRRRKIEKNEAPAIGQKLKEYESKYPDQVMFIWLLLYSGARPSEIAAARRSDLSGNMIILSDHKTAAHTEDVRTIYLPSFLSEKLRALPAAENDALLGVKSPRHLWDKIRKETGSDDLHIYDLRRSFASIALAAGYSLDQIGELFNHMNAQTTKGYAWLEAGKAAEAANDIGNRIAEIMV